MNKLSSEKREICRALVGTWRTRWQHRPWLGLEEWFSKQVKLSYTLCMNSWKEVGGVIYPFSNLPSLTISPELLQGYTPASWRTRLQAPRVPPSLLSGRSSRVVLGFDHFEDIILKWFPDKGPSDEGGLWIKPDNWGQERIKQRNYRAAMMDAVAAAVQRCNPYLDNK